MGKVFLLDDGTGTSGVPNPVLVRSPARAEMCNLAGKTWFLREWGKMQQIWRLTAEIKTVNLAALDLRGGEMKPVMGID